MLSSLLPLLVDPRTKQRLRVQGQQGDELIEGVLSSDSGNSYRVTHGIPRFVENRDAGQAQTMDSFGYKWQRLDSYASASIRANSTRWLLERYGFRDVADMQRFFAARGSVLDAGCGGGYSSSQWLAPDWQQGGDAQWIGADISSAIDVARGRLGQIPGTHFLQADLMQLPFAAGSFGAIFSEGVLHHTPSTRAALLALAPLLARGGQLLFYVYKRKGPIREFTDDYVRNVIAELPPDRAWEALRPLTRLGEALASLKVEVDVPEDIPYLGIRAGRQDVQRLIYWSIAKLYWNDGLSFEENHHVNFDWYHPRYAHRQSEEEVRSWCAEAGLSIVRFDVQESGFTVRADRN
jgi:SAM-dependent methyltransferase